MSTALGIGVIGMGWMGQVHSRSYGQIKDRFCDLQIEPQLVICSDSVKSRADEARQRFGFAEATTEWRHVVEHPAVDVVNIAAPNGLHLEMVQAAARAGKHIFCEKPVGKDPVETAQCEQAARQAGVLTFVGYNYRWPPLVQATRALIESGRLGNLLHYRGRFFSCYASDPFGVLSWRFQKEHGLGTLGDLMSHVIDMAHMLVGPIEKTISDHQTFIPHRPLATPGEGTHFSVGSADSPTGEVTNEDYVNSLVRFKDGVHGNLDACRVFPVPKCEMAFEVTGTQGAVKWNFERMNEIEVRFGDQTASDDGFTTVQAGPEHPHHARFNPGPGIGLGYEDIKAIEAVEFLKSIQQGAQASPGFTDALAVADVQSAMIDSWQSQRWEKVVSTKL